ncbi:MAG: sodium/sugar symporter [Prevotellaceae bacterium]|jgi:SSS family solute:Na+ symporter|nr:sodium/sugar symporter [Prevotellaceae bacterium]
MISGFQTIDFVIVGIYLVVLIALGLFLSRKGGKEKDSKDYFLAGNKLTWWAVGASLIAANISAEQFIGMSGSGFRIGLCVAAYELMAAITLIIVAKFLLPAMIKSNIYTIPQFLKERYNKGVGLSFSIFWLLLYVFVNLTSVAWLGALAVKQIMGIESFMFMDMTFDFLTVCIVGLFVIAGVYSIYGGLASVAWTDVLQVIFLVGGGLITAYFALESVSGHGKGAIEGFKIVYNYVKEIPNDTHFNLIVNKTNDPIAFKDLPGIAGVVGALWFTNLGYWGFNQYIIQKGLAAKNINEAKKGLIFAGYLKILIPFIVVIPGITAFVLFHAQGADPSSIPGLAQNYFDLHGTIEKADDAYPWLIRNFAPTGVRGLAFAALVAAIISSLASMLNSTSTIFTMDIYKEHINKKASEKRLVNVGRITALVALVIAVFTVKPLLGGLDQAFQYIQEYSGFIYPGIVIVFGLGLLWKRASGRAAIWTSILTLPLGILFKVCFPEMPFLSRMGWVAALLFICFIVLTFMDKKSVAADPVTDEDKGKMKKWSTILGSVAAVFFVAFLIQKIAYAAGAEFAIYLNNISFQSILVSAMLLAVCALFLFSNANDNVKDPKSIPVDLSLFKTNKGFGIAAAGICIIIAAIYIIFW